MGCHSDGAALSILPAPLLGPSWVRIRYPKEGYLDSSRAGETEAWPVVVVEVKEEVLEDVIVCEGAKNSGSGAGMGAWSCWGGVSVFRGG